MRPGTWLGAALASCLIAAVFFHPRPSRPRLAAAAAAAADIGWDVLVERRARPAVAAVGNGGWVTLRHEPSGALRRYGPGIFLECQAYDLDWFLMGMRWGLGRERDRPLAEEAVRVLVRTQDPRWGHWPWSDDGCIHENLGLELLRAGRRAEAGRALRWAMEWVVAGHVLPDGHPIEVESTHILKSWGPLQTAPTPPDKGIPPPPPARTDRYAYAWDELPFLLRFLLESGQASQYPEAERRLKLGLRLLVEGLDPGPAGSVDFIALVGLTDYLEMVRDGMLPRDGLYRLALDRVRGLARAEAGKRPTDPVVLALLLSAVAANGLMAESPDLADRLAANLLSAQDAGGEWLLPAFLIHRDWFGKAALDSLPGSGAAQLPPEDRMVGELDSLPTAYAVRALHDYAAAAGKP